MADCKLMFFDARRAVQFGRPLTFTDHAILKVSDPLTHVEFRFSQRHKGVSQSSTMSNGDDGCRNRFINYTKHRERWIPLSLPMTNKQEDVAWSKGCELSDLPIDWMSGLSITNALYQKTQHGFRGIHAKKYDKIGVLSLTTGLDIIKPDPNKLWCSEDVLELCKAGYGWDDLKCDQYAPLRAFFEVMFRLRSL